MRPRKTPGMTSPAGGGPSLPWQEVERAARRSRSAGPWSLEHLRRCWLVLVPVGVVMAAIVALTVGGRGAAGVGLGMAIVGAFFTMSAVIIAAVGARHPKAVLVTALALYLAKIVALGIVIVTFPLGGPIDARWMAIAVVVGLLAWMGAHVHYVITAKVFYVDPH